MMTPFLPKSSQKAWEYLNQEGKIEDHGWDSALEYKADFNLQQPLPLFSKLNMQEILEKEMPPEETNELANVKPEITFDDFKKLDIRIGTVEKVEAHPNADKLWLLDVNFGGPTRRIVTGLRGIYESEDLLGKKIAVLVNLAPAKFRGEESNGMLLAAEANDIVSLLQPDKEIEDGSEAVSKLDENRNSRRRNFWLSYWISCRKSRTRSSSFESESDVGGRMSSVRFGPYIIDIGFHVLHTAYPSLHRWIDFSKLEFKEMEKCTESIDPDTGRRQLFADAISMPLKLFPTLRATGLRDGLRLLRWRLASNRKDIESPLDFKSEKIMVGFKQRGFSEYSCSEYSPSVVCRHYSRP